MSLQKRLEPDPARHPNGWRAATRREWRGELMMAVVFIDDESYAALVEEVEDLRDRLSVYERTGETIPFAQLVGDLGLNGEVYAAPAS